MAVTPLHFSILSTCIYCNEHVLYEVDNFMEQLFRKVHDINLMNVICLVKHGSHVGCIIKYMRGWHVYGFYTHYPSQWAFRLILQLTLKSIHEVSLHAILWKAFVLCLVVCHSSSGNKSIGGTIQKYNLSHSHIFQKYTAKITNHFIQKYFRLFDALEHSAITQIQSLCIH